MSHFQASTTLLERFLKNWQNVLVYEKCSSQKNTINANFWLFAVPFSRKIKTCYISPPVQNEVFSFTITLNQKLRQNVESKHNKENLIKQKKLTYLKEWLSDTIRRLHPLLFQNLVNELESIGAIMKTITTKILHHTKPYCKIVTFLEINYQEWHGNLLLIF